MSRALPCVVALLLVSLPCVSSVCPGSNVNPNTWRAPLTAAGYGDASTLNAYCSGSNHAWYVSSSISGSDACCCPAYGDSGDFSNNCVVLAPGISISGTTAWKEAWCALGRGCSGTLLRARPLSLAAYPTWWSRTMLPSVGPTSLRSSTNTAVGAPSQFITCATQPRAQGRAPYSAGRGPV